MNKLDQVICMIGWKSEIGVASYLFSMTRVNIVDAEHNDTKAKAEAETGKWCLCLSC